MEEDTIHKNCTICETLNSNNTVRDVIFTVIKAILRLEIEGYSTDLSSYICCCIGEHAAQRILELQQQQLTIN